MKVRILFFGMLKDLVRRDHEELELPEGSSIADVLTHYGSQVPDLKKWFSSVALAVNQQYVGPNTKLKAGDEIALLPPVSGGASFCE
ncbi:MAG: MoaD/ThiS family protein [Tumebacillaceae bacterium]